MSADAYDPHPGSLPPVEGVGPDSTSSSAAAPLQRGPIARDTRLVTSQQLFAGAVEVQIDHRGVFYRLRQTSLGKLILTK